MERVIFGKVQDYLTDFVGELTAPGQPVFDATAGFWSVPVFCKTPKAVLPVGEFRLNESAEFIAIPEKEQMLHVLRAQLERLPD